MPFIDSENLHWERTLNENTNINYIYDKYDRIREGLKDIKIIEDKKLTPDEQYLMWNHVGEYESAIYYDLIRLRETIKLMVEELRNSDEPEIKKLTDSERDFYSRVKETDEKLEIVEFLLPQIVYNFEDAPNIRFDKVLTQNGVIDLAETFELGCDVLPLLKDMAKEILNYKKFKESFSNLRYKKTNFDLYDIYGFIKEVLLSILEILDIDAVFNVFDKELEDMKSTDLLLSLILTI